jgi:hypothetical protein
MSALTKGTMNSIFGRVDDDVEPQLLSDCVSFSIGTEAIAVVERRSAEVEQELMKRDLLSFCHALTSAGEPNFHGIRH